MSIYIGLLLIAVVWIGAASMQRGGRISAGTQRVLVGLVTATVVAGLLLQWWGRTRQP